MTPMTAAVLLDIEGTTTAISFVYDALFPYAAQAIPAFVRARAHEPAVRAAVDAILNDALPSEREVDPLATAIAVVQRQMAADVKATGLKQLQGLVWQHGYETGAIKGHVYADVPTMFSTWQKSGRQIAIYSSGSVLAQKLLFRHSVAGDLTPYLCGHYDTQVGPKREAASYTAIAAAWKKAPGEITFCSDQPAECAAAVAAGMQAIVLLRPGNPPLPANLPFPIHADFFKV